MAQVDTNGNRGLFSLHEQLAHLHTGNTQKKVSNIVSDKVIMEKKNTCLSCYVIQASLVTWFSHNAFLFNLWHKSKRSLLREHHQKEYFC